MSAVRFVARWWAFFALLAAAAMLATAHAFQHWGGLAPCPLCLKQRDVYWFAIAVAAPASAWAALVRAKRTPRVASFLLFAIFAAGAITATFHAGGELKWWDLPASCGGGGAVSVDTAALQAILGGATVNAPTCDVAAWTFLGVSMAGWNALISAGLALFSLAASMRGKESPLRAK